MAVSNGIGSRDGCMGGNCVNMCYVKFGNDNSNRLWIHPCVFETISAKRELSENAAPHTPHTPEAQ